MKGDNGLWLSSPDLIFKWRQQDIPPKSNRKVGLPEVMESYLYPLGFPKAHGYLARKNFPTSLAAECAYMTQLWSMENGKKWEEDLK